MDNMKRESQMPKTAEAPKSVLTDGRVTLAVVLGFGGLMLGALFAPIDAAQKGEVIAALGVIGTALAGVLRGMR